MSVWKYRKNDKVIDRTTGRTLTVIDFTDDGYKVRDSYGVRDTFYKGEFERKTMIK